MTVYNPRLVAIDSEETRRYAGLRDGVSFPDGLLDQACAEALLLASPGGCWQTYAYDAETSAIHSHPSVRLTGAKLARHLSAAVEVAVMAVTIGAQLETASSAHFGAGDYTAGLLLDAAGSTAVETVADAINSLIAAEAARRGLRALSRFSPGYGDWAITDQPVVLNLAGGGLIGITVTPSCMLSPRKSVTAIVGLQPAAAGHQPEVCHGEDCHTCSLVNCYARKGSRE